MASGHTDRATINMRRPLTKNMRETLWSFEQDDKRSRLNCSTMRLQRAEMTTAEKNAARALMDRGLLTWDDRIGVYVITAAGHAALAEHDWREG